jgi:WD40 repeat protein
VRLWDPHTGRQIGAPLSEGTASVLSVAFNGRAVASSADDGTIRLTELVSGRTMQFSVGEAASTVAFSPDGRLLASGSKAGVDLWNAADRTPSGPALANSSSPLSGTLAFDPRGHRIAAADGQGRDIAIWDLATRRMVVGPLTFSPPSRVVSLAFSPDGRRLAAAYRDNTVRLWNVDTGAQYTDPLRGHTDFIWSVAFSPNGDRVASGGLDGTVRVWAADTGRPLAGAFTGHYRAVYVVAFSPDGTRIASAGEDTTIRMWPAVATPEMLCDKLGATARTITPEQWRQWISPDIGFALPCPAPFVGS